MNGSLTRAVCIGCDKVRSIYGSRGYCRTCAQTSLDVEDNESPSVLDESGWYNDRGIMRHTLGRAS